MNLKKLFAWIFCLMLFLADAMGQDLKGIWVGGLVKDTTGVRVINPNYVLHIKEQANNVIRGKAYVLATNYRLEGVLNFVGSIRDNLVTIHETNIISSRTPTDTIFLCMKVMHLKLTGTNMAMTGPWTGRIETLQACIPAKAWLERYNAAGNKIIPPKILSAIAGDSKETMFLSTTLNNPVLVNVTSRNVVLSINDYLREDNDTITVYQNRQPIIEKLRIENQVYSKRLRIDRSSDICELIIYANNLGIYPPNTCTMTIDDGVTKQNVNITTSKQVSAALYLRYLPPLP